MSGICGYVGQGDPAVLEAMLAAIDYRGDRTDTAHAPGVGLGYRWWGGRPGKSPGIHRDGPHLVACSGTFAPPVPSPAAALIERVRSGLHSLDGAFAGAWWDGQRQCLTLIRDSFGVRSLYYVEHGGTFYFASELKQLLTIPGLPVTLDHAALHKYLTFSFVPGEDVPILGIRRLLPGRIATRENGRLTVTPYFALKEQIEPRLADRRAAVRLVRRCCEQAVARRLNGESEVGLFLSGASTPAGSRSG
ncbi:MAG: hypothetical protein L0Z62_13880 [Gemmataceae bacterium]|nr:hypothetical protein [Gemmataceae bacterium]